MKPKKFTIASAVTTAIITAFGIFVDSAQALIIGGKPNYSHSTLPSVLTVDKETVIDLNPGFTVSQPEKLQIGSLLLNGTLGSFGVTDIASYDPVKAYITGFQYLGREAVLDLDGDSDTIFGFIRGSTFSVQLDFTGNIRDQLTGAILSRAAGGFSASSKDGLGNYSLNVEAIPTPALLPGIMGLGLGVLRKHRNSKITKSV